MAYWSEWLTKWTPLSGRFIRENGQFSNLADMPYELNAVDNQLSVVRGQVFQSSWQGSVAAGASLYFSHPIAAGILARQVATVITYQGGPFDYTERIGATPGATAETIQGYNADRRLILTPSTSPVFRVGAPTGGTIVDRSFGDSAASGVSRQTNGLSVAGIGGYFDSDHYPIYGIQNTGLTALQISMDLVWKEISNA